MISTQTELEAALLDGGDIDCDSTVPIDLTDAMQVTRPSRIRGGRFTRGSGPAFMVTSSDVELDGVDIAGGPGVYDATQKFIYAKGSAVEPLAGVRVRNCRMLGSRGDNVWLEWCTDSVVADNDIGSYLYSGAMVISGRDVLIANNLIRDAPLSDGVVNTYGVAITDLANTEAARSRDCSVIGNHVSRVDWEGIDTHGGDRLTITGNHVVGCPSGIALVTGNSSRLYAPTNCLVSGNTITAEGARRPLRAAVNLVGIAGKPASATIAANQLLGYDDQDPIFTSYWARGDTYIGGNNKAFVPWTPIEMGPDYIPNSAYPPEYMVDGNTGCVRGGVIPRSGGVAARTDIGRLPHPAAWPTTLTVIGFAKGSKPGAGNAQVAVTQSGELQMLYGVGTDAYTYWLTGTYQAA